jgi:predicted nucleotidyltransferase component of viral defense system
MATAQPTIQAAERFHLAFLTHLGAAVDKRLYSLKGGCNLRFFFKSIRYSEDVDFDIHTIAKQTLQKRVDQILNGAPLARLLFLAQIEITRVSKPKQTDTTQRWKVQLRATGMNIPTRIEFSRRRFDPGVIFDPVDVEITRAYNLKAILASHYDLESAFAQKIEALALRSQTQARDLFDLVFLAERGAKGLRVKREQLDAASENVSSISRDQFMSQVVAFMIKEYQDYYNSPKTWEQLQDGALTMLEQMR